MQTERSFENLLPSQFGIHAASSALDGLSAALTMPEAVSDGKIPTLNKTGFMTPEIDDFVADFISIAPGFAKQGAPVLDIGCAYGIATIPTLENGGIVIASDMDMNHLLLLREKTPRHLWRNLYLNQGCLPDQPELPNNSIGAILARRVTHFLKPNEMEKMLDKMMQWLVPGGFAYIINVSPYHYMYEGFGEIYEKRWQNGADWPGEVFDNKDYISDPEILQNAPDYINLMDDRPLTRALKKRGFDIVKSELYGFTCSLEKDPAGRGHCGVKAQKPF